MDERDWLHLPNPIHYRMYATWVHAVHSHRFDLSDPLLRSRWEWVHGKGFFHPGSRPMTMEEFYNFVRPDNNERRHPAHPPPSAPAAPPTPTYPAAPPLGQEEASAPDGTPDDRLCVACLDRPKVVVAVPCGHVSTCVTCAATARPQVCPVCRTPVTMMVKTFL
jgi:hypothetical protein